jgi:hypothetical protein
VSDASGSAQHLRIATALLCVVVAQTLSGCGSARTRETSGGLSGDPRLQKISLRTEAPLPEQDA